MPPRRVPLAVAAGILGISQSGLRKRIKRGELPTIRDNRNRLLVDVHTLVDTPEVAPRDILLVELQHRVQDLEAERDRLLGIIERLAERPPRRWWRWWPRG